MKSMKCVGIILITLCLLINVYSAAERFEYTYPDDWSRDALMFAVENGILAGDENHDLNPSKNITRAEMAAVLVRLLGATEKTDLSAYHDVDASAWYYTELSAAVACGIFSGISSTMMQPNNAITREQAVVVLCRAFGIVSENRETYQEFSDRGKISAYARDSVSAMKELGLASGYSDGSFGPRRSITRAEVAQLLYNIFDCIADTPAEIPASGTVMYRGREALPENFVLDGTLILGQAMPSDIVATDWNITNRLVLRTGNHTRAEFSGLTTDQLVCAPLNGTVVCGEVPSLYFWGNAVEYSGDALSLTVMGGTHSFTGTSGSITLRGGSLTHNGGTESVLMEASTTLIMNGEANSITINGDNTTVSGNGKASVIIVYYEYRTITLAYDELKDVWYENYIIEHDNALNVVQTQRIPCTVLYDTVLYTDFSMTETICEVPAGSIVYNEYHPKNSKMCVSMADGTKGYINRWLCDLPLDMVTTDGTLDYSEATKEGFVDLMDCRSATNYLIWVSKYTQKVMVFEGTRGDWNLIKTFPCSTGTNDTPTPAGMYYIFDHEKRWYYPDHCIDNVSYFSGEHAFHSVLMNYDGTFYNGTVGVPLSHGCVRLLPEAAKYIYNLPAATGVIVY